MNLDWTSFLAVVDGWKLLVLILLLVLNFVGGIIVALYTKTFQLKMVGDIFRAKVVPYVLGYMGAAVVAAAQPDYAPMFTAAWAALLASLVGSFLAHLKELGINIPTPLAGPPAE